MILDDFIVFEGIDGSGTTTQIALLKEALRQNGAAARVFFSAEPSSAATGTFLRSVLSGGVPSAGGTRAYLFAADRFEHLYGDGGVVAALNAGKAAVSDRYFFSSLAYQGIECGRELPEALNRDFPLPRYLFFFDIDAALAAERLSVRATAEIYENRAFLEKAVSAYRRVVGEYEAGEKGRGMRVVHIDASRPKVEIAGIIWNALQPVPAFRGAPALPCLF